MVIIKFQICRRFSFWSETTFWSKDRTPVRDGDSVRHRLMLSANTPTTNTCGAGLLGSKNNVTVHLLCLLKDECARLQEAHARTGGKFTLEHEDGKATQVCVCVCLH